MLCWMTLYLDSEEFTCELAEIHIEIFDLLLQRL